jgi:hypothetical protein
MRSIGRLGGQGVVKQARHSTLPFENLRVLSIVEGLMALSQSKGRIEGLGSTLVEPQVVLERKAFSVLSVPLATLRERV